MRWDLLAATDAHKTCETEPNQCERSRLRNYHGIGRDVVKIHCPRREALVHIESVERNGSRTRWSDCLSLRKNPLTRWASTIQKCGLSSEERTSGTTTDRDGSRCKNDIASVPELHLEQAE